MSSASAHLKSTSVKNTIKLFLQIAFISGIIGFLFLGNNIGKLSWGALFKYWLTFSVSTALLWVGNSMLPDWLSKYYPWIEMPVKRLIISLIATFVFTFIIWIIIILMFYYIENKENLFKYFYSAWRNFMPTLLITLFISIFMHGRSFLLSWRESHFEAERLKKEQIAARYEALRNQVNPHFLFNSLNVLTTLVHKDADVAEKFVRQLSSVYRYVLESRDKEVVSVEEELRVLESYLFLMKIRFGESLQIKIEAPTEGGKIIPLALQLLVENALKHNEVSKARPLYIQIDTENDDTLVIRNNIQIKNSVSESTGVGLENIKARYKFLTNRAISVQNDGQYFTVKIPIIN